MEWAGLGLRMRFRCVDSVSFGDALSMMLWTGLEVTGRLVRRKAIVAAAIHRRLIKTKPFSIIHKQYSTQVDSPHSRERVRCRVLGTDPHTLVHIFDRNEIQISQMSIQRFRPESLRHLRNQPAPGGCVEQNHTIRDLMFNGKIRHVSMVRQSPSDEHMTVECTKGSCLCVDDDDGGLLTFAQLLNHSGRQTHIGDTHRHKQYTETH